MIYTYSYVHIHIYTFACTSCPVCTLVQSDMGHHMKTLKGEGTKNIAPADCHTTNAHTWFTDSGHGIAIQKPAEDPMQL